MNAASLANLAPYKPGQSGNPGGKPQLVRNRITAHFLHALSDDFEEHGKATIAAAREKDPVGYLKVVAALLPKQVEAIEPMGDLADHELVAMIGLLRAKLSEMTPEQLEGLKAQVAGQSDGA